MDILIPDEWLREFLTTKATPKQIAEYLSLCGPSVEKVEKKENDAVYSIEVTTNRVDEASVYGIAREGAAILPRFKIPAALKPIKPAINQKVPNRNLPLSIKCNIGEVRRVMAVVIDNVSTKSSPLWLKRRLEMSGLRSLNLLIDITNYLMLELGHPTHVFDYDRIKSHTLVFRKSDKGEKIETLENKVYSVPGEDIVIDNGEGEIIDLPGIIGTANSVVTGETKRIIFFIDNNDPVHMRRTSMSLGIRTAAVSLNEKDVNPELATVAFARGVELYRQLAKGKIASKVFDIYLSPYKAKKVSTTISFINDRLGISLSKSEISKILSALGFEPDWSGKNLEVSVPSWRASDIQIEEDIVEEIARIYGYHNLPSKLMGGEIPEPLPASVFEFETKVKEILKGFGGVEVYTLSLVPKDYIEAEALRLKNPLGVESEYLRNGLLPSLIKAANDNAGATDSFHLFEMANVYVPRKGELPKEVMTLGGIFANTPYREAKGIVEGLLGELNVKYVIEPEDSKHFLPSRRIKIKVGQNQIGQLGILDDGKLIYYEFDMESLKKESRLTPSYHPIPKYPAQIEDITLNFPPKTKVGDVISSITSITRFIEKVELRDIYKDAHTFRLWYQHPTKTLTDSEVEKIRNKIISELRSKFGAVLKA